MVQCWVPDCKHYNVRETCRMFRFPKDSKTRNRWIKLTRRTVEPGPGAYLCSCHFVDGKKENGPTLFAYNKEKQLKFSSPEKRTRKKTSEQTVSNEEVDMLYVLQYTFYTAFTKCFIYRCVNEPQPSTSKQVDEPHSETSTSHASVDAENYYLRLDLERATEKLMHLTDRFSFDIVKGKDKLVLLYTGLPTEKIFMSLFNLLKDIEMKYYFKWKV
nr:unnamed protein product [Callosobruchus chinensis]